MEYDQNIEHYPLADAIDHEILMHREAHFGGHFPTMIDYYLEGRKGVQPEFDKSRIEKLAILEKDLGQNLAALFLAGNEVEKVAESKNFYKQLRSIYEIENPKNRIPQLIADLILTEEEEAEEEIKAIVAEKEKIVPALIDLLRTEELYDPLFPGYGQAPSLAVKALGLIGDKRAIISLFETLGQGDFFADDQILKALKAIGEPAKKFLLKVVEKKPINEDNERAAIALIQFKEDEDVVDTCLRLLHDPDVQHDPCLPTYLVLACEDITDLSKQNALIQLSKEEHLSHQLQDDIKIITRGWGR